MKIDFKNPIPLYIQIAEDIKSEIRTGVFTEGDRLDSQANLAKKYNVSLITIKKALSDLVKEGILYSRVGKGTYVSKNRSSMNLTESKTIGIVLSDLKNPFFSLIVESIERKSSEEGYSLLLSSSSDRVDKEEKQIDHFRQIGAEGLIIASITHQYYATPTIQKLHRDNFPFVMVSYVEDQDVPFVGTDHQKGAYIATNHLFRAGYKKIGYINAEAGNRLGEIREKGYVEALRDHHQSYDRNLVYQLKWNDYQSGYEIGRQVALLDTGRPEAFFVFSDIAALGFEQALLDQGLEVPEDVAIVGFDDIKRDLYAPVPLTTVHQPIDEIGELSFEILLKKINHLEVPTKTILDPTLVVRSSCGYKSFNR